MKEYTSDIAFTDTVKSIQKREGSRDIYAHMEQRGSWEDTVTKQLADFIAQRDSFYLATVNAECQPYIQHRGGPKGFLKVLDKKNGYKFVYRILIFHWAISLITTRYACF